MSAPLYAQDLAFGYAGRKILKDLSLTLHQGEILALLGPNGSGKSTLLRLLSGLEKPWSGRVMLDGKNAAALSGRERARRLAYLPQQEEEPMALTVRQSVLWGRSPWQNWLGMPGREDFRLAGEAIGALGLAALAEKDLRRLSGGERQRAALARAVCQAPAVFLLDEPTSALDYRHQILVMNLLRSLCRAQNAAVAMVSHDVNLAAMYADRVLLLKDGGILALGRPEDTLSEELCSALYDCPIQVDRNPATGALRVCPVPGTGGGRERGEVGR